MISLDGVSFYASTDSGGTWTFLGPSAVAIGSHYLTVALSSDGNKSAMAAYGWTSVVVETHEGLWGPLSTVALLGSGFTAGVAWSADGTKLAAYLNGIDPTPGGRLYTSGDAGSNWTVTVVPATNLTSIASSADGTRLAAVATGDTIYMSTNSGATWMAVGVPFESWTSIASSADGNKMAAVANGGGIFTWQATPRPLLNIKSSDGQVVFCWTVPSMNFELQQATATASSTWTIVAPPPTLNYTNLESQVTVPKPPRSMFYRLALKAVMN